MKDKSSYLYFVFANHHLYPQKKKKGCGIKIIEFEPLASAACVLFDGVEK